MLFFLGMFIGFVLGAFLFIRASEVPTNQCEHEFDKWKVTERTKWNLQNDYGQICGKEISSVQESQCKKCGFTETTKKCVRI